MISVKFAPGDEFYFISHDNGFCGPSINFERVTYVFLSKNGMDYTVDTDGCYNEGIKESDCFDNFDDAWNAMKPIYKEYLEARKLKRDADE